MSGATPMSIGTPRTLFRVPASTTLESFDVTADIQRFLLLAVDETISKPTIKVITNWSAPLK